MSRSHRRCSRRLPDFRFSTLLANTKRVYIICVMNSTTCFVVVLGIILVAILVATQPPKSEGYYLRDDPVWLGFRWIPSRRLRSGLCRNSLGSPRNVRCSGSVRGVLPWCRFDMVVKVVESGDSRPKVNMSVERDESTALMVGGKSGDRWEGSRETRYLWWV